MRLEIDGSHVIEDPSADDIADALRSLSGHDSFAILSSSEQFFVQCSGSHDRGFDLEYRMGNDRRHCRAESDPLPLSTVTRAFQK